MSAGLQAQREIDPMFREITAHALDYFKIENYHD